MKAVNPNATEDLIAPGDEGLPPEEQSILELTQPTVEEEAYLLDITGNGSRLVAALHLGLGGVRNFKDLDGKPVVLKRDPNKAPILGDKRPWITDQLALIPFQARAAPAKKIINGVGVTKAEAKNL